VFLLPAGIDLSFLKGETLIQVAVGGWDVQMRFSNGSAISIEDQCEVEMDGHLHEVGPPAGAALLALLGHDVSSATVVENRHVELWFGDKRVVVRDTDEPYAYYSVADPDGKLVI
jgi:Family of unknown function (DUF6188)